MTNRRDIHFYRLHRLRRTKSSRSSKTVALLFILAVLCLTVHTTTGLQSYSTSVRQQRPSKITSNPSSLSSLLLFKKRYNWSRCSNFNCHDSTNDDDFEQQRQQKLPKEEEDEYKRRDYVVTREDTMVEKNRPPLELYDHPLFRSLQSRRGFLASWAAATVSAPTVGGAAFAAFDNNKNSNDVTSRVDCGASSSRNCVDPTSSSSSLLPFSSVRRYKVLTLQPNGLRVLLVSDKRALRASAALSIGDAGQFSDPRALPGLAHLMEHMVLSYNSRSRFRQSRDFEEWLEDRDGFSNAFTAYDHVCFHFSCPYTNPSTTSATTTSGAADSDFAEALERFASLFLEDDVIRVCQSVDTLRREVRRVDAELDFNDVSIQASQLLRSFVNTEHPYSRFSAGSLETLERIPKQQQSSGGNNINVAESLVQFFQDHYLPSRAVLVVLAPSELSVMERLVAPFATTLSSSPAIFSTTVSSIKGAGAGRSPILPAAFLSTTTTATARRYRKQTISSVKRSYPGGFLYGNRPKQMVLYHKQENANFFETLSFEWVLNLDYSTSSTTTTGTTPTTPTTTTTTIITASQIAFILSQIFGRRGPGSLYLFLLRRGWTPSGSTASVPKFATPLDVSGMQIIKLSIPLTLEGFLNRSAIVAAVYDIIQSLRRRQGEEVFSRILLSQYATIAKLQGYVLTPRPPDAVELAVDAQLYPLGSSSGGGSSSKSGSGGAFTDGSSNTISSGQWYRFPSPDDRNSLVALQKAVMSLLATTMSDPENAVIIATAGNKALSLSGKNRPLSIIGGGSTPEKSYTGNSNNNNNRVKWLQEPISGARFYFDDMLNLQARLEEIALQKLVDNEELQGPVLNPLIPPYIRPARTINDACCGTTSSSASKNKKEKDIKKDILVRPEGGRTTLLARSQEMTIYDEKNTNWLVLDQLSSASTSGLPLPRGPPEPTCRCAFVFQLLSSRSARANVRQAAHAELWKLTFERAVEDIAELGVPGGLAYDISFNKFGLRLCFVGISQTLPSYARRLFRRLVEHHFRLLGGPETLPTAITTAAVAAANRASGLTPQRRRPIVSNLRASTAYDAATEGLAFLKSCNGAVCFGQGDLLRDEVENLISDLRIIYDGAIGPGGRTQVALPTIEDLSYKASWKPRAASPCAVPGGILINDACGRIPR